MSNVRDHARQYHQRVIRIAIVIASAASVAHAASFDCAKANSTVEELICSDQWLSNIDEEISNIYSSLLSESSSAAAREIQKSQRTWIVNVRDKCADSSCLITAYQNRRWELAERLKDFDCEDYARTTGEMDGCGRSKLDNLDQKMQNTFKALLKALESPDCCDSTNQALARELASKSQEHWLKFREAECSGHYETISAGTLRGGFYLGCARSLTEERIKQLSHWGTVDIDESESTETDGNDKPRRAKKKAPK